MHCGVSYNVCRKGFMAMHGLSRDRVELVARKKKASVNGSPPGDKLPMRGNGGGQQKGSGPELQSRLVISKNNLILPYLCKNNLA